MNANVASQKTKRKFKVRYSRGLRNQNGEHHVNLCESNNLETQVLFPTCNEIVDFIFC